MKTAPSSGNPKTASATAGRRNRRLKSQDTRRRILDAATDLFLDEGYSTTNLERIAEVAKVTKPTVYSHFESKKGLFDAVVKRNADTRVAEISKYFTPSEDPRTDLILFGDFLMDRVLNEETRRWDRLAAAESISHPEVGEAFYQAGPAQVIKGLTDYFRQQQKAGFLEFPHAERAAEQLIGMFLGLNLLRAQIGQPPLSTAQRKRRCREAVDVFLAAYQR